MCYSSLHTVTFVKERLTRGKLLENEKENTLKSTLLMKQCTRDDFMPLFLLYKKRHQRKYNAKQEKNMAQFTHHFRRLSTSVEQYCFGI